MPEYGTATGAGSGTVDLAELAAYPAEANLFDMHGISNVTDNEHGKVTAFTQASNRLTFAPAATWTGAIIEVWQPGLNAGFVNDAINEAIDTISEDHLEEWSAVTVGTEDGRQEYPISSTPRFIYGVQIFKGDPMLGVGSAALNTFRGLSNVSAAQQLAQTFDPGKNDNLVRGVLAYLRINGTISSARTITCAIQTTSSGAPSGTQVTGASATYSTDDISTPGYYFFDFGRPVELDDAVYAVVLSTTGGVDATNFSQWGEDTDGGYTDGSLYTYNGSAWSAVSGSDMLFYVVPWGTDWQDLMGHEWDVRVETSNAFVTLLGDEGKPVYTEMGAGYTWGEGRPIRFLGYSTSDRPTTDTDNIDAPRAYIQAKSLAIVLRSVPPDGSAADPLMWIKYYDSIAEKERQAYPVRTFLHPNARRVRTAGG